MILTPTAYESVMAQQEEEYQKTLLSFYTQQLVAHGAEFFAAAMAAITFTSKFIDGAKARKRSIIAFIVFSGLLLGLMIYVIIRLTYYGYLAGATLEYKKPPSIPSFSSLNEYKNATNYFMEEHYGKDPLFTSVNSLCKNDILFKIPYSMIVAIIAGFLVALIIFLAFSDSALKNQPSPNPSTVTIIKNCKKAIEESMFHFHALRT